MTDPRYPRSQISLRRAVRRLGFLINLILALALGLQSVPVAAAAISSNRAGQGTTNVWETINARNDYQAIAAAGTITNTVSVDSSTTDPNSVNNTAVQTTTVTSVADLQISKSDGVTTVTPGTTIAYTIIVTNAGPSAVLGAIVTDPLPAAISSAAWSCSAEAGSSCGDASGTDDIDTTVDLAVGGTATFTVVANILWTATGTLNNTATITPPADTSDPNPGNNSSTDSDTLLTGTLTGVVYLDTNNSNGADSGEGLPNVTVVITTSVGTTFTATTDSNGGFSVTVPAGDTQVDVVDSDLPAGVVQIEGTDATTVMVPAGGTANDVNGYELEGQVYGHIFEDINGDGDQDAGEPDLPNVAVVIADAFGITQTVTTDVNGNYTATVPISNGTTFTDTVIVDVVESTLPAGSLQTAGTDPDSVVVTAGTATNAGDDGYQRQGLVQGVVYMDENGDGVYTAGTDTPLPTVTVTVTDSNGVGYTLVTNANGAYSQTVPAGDTIVDIDDSDPDLPADVVLTGGSSDPTTVTVPGGGSATDDTGYVLLASLGDRLWLDLNADGVQDANEPGLGSVSINLSLAGSVVATTTTGPTGYYNFSDLRPGDYTVSIDTATLPAGVTQTFDRDGTLNDETGVTIASNSAIVDADFGYQGDSAIGDRVWNDRNGNGLQSGDETGTAGALVTLTLADGWTITSTTSLTGAYTFAGLIPGIYTVTVDSTTLPTGAVQTADRDETLDNATVVTLAAATTIPDADFGYQEQGALIGHIYEDVNGNNTQDAGEPDLGNVTVMITDSLGVTYTLSTDASGNYTVTLPIGDASVDVDEATLPAGMVQTEGDDPTTATVPAGDTVDAGNDGYQRQGLVEGTVYMDTNNNGVYDVGTDVALDTVTVTVTDSNGVTYTVITNGAGYFSQVVPAGATEVAVNDSDLPVTAMIENGFTDPDTVTVPGGGVASTNFPYVEPLVIDKDAVTPAVVAGTQVTYTITARNSGATALTNVTISDTLPAGFTFANSSITANSANRTATSDPTVGAVSPTWGSWTLNAGGNVTILFTANVASSVAAGVYDNTAYATSDQTGLVNDDGTAAQDNNTPTGEDPEADEDVTISTVADLAVFKYDNPDPVAAGNTLTYTIVVTNYGPSDAQNVVITDTLSADTTVVSANGCAVNGSTVVCDFGTIANGASESVTIVVTVSAEVLIASATDGSILVEAPVASEEIGTTQAQPATALRATNASTFPVGLAVVLPNEVLAAANADTALRVPASVTSATLVQPNLTLAEQSSYQVSILISGAGKAVPRNLQHDGPVLLS